MLCLMAIRADLCSAIQLGCYPDPRGVGCGHKKSPKRLSKGLVRMRGEATFAPAIAPFYMGARILYDALTWWRSPCVASCAETRGHRL
jgi:hypothetical protein